MLEPKTTSRRRNARHGGRPKAADVDKLNQDILTAAGDLFMQYGFDGTSMDAVAEKAKVSKRTLYLRHADKSALFNTAIYELLGRFLVPLELIRQRNGRPRLGIGCSRARHGYGSRAARVLSGISSSRVRSTTST